MKKRLLILIMVLMLVVSVFCLAGCDFLFGSNDDDTNNGLTPSNKTEQVNKVDIAGKTYKFSICSVIYQKAVYPTIVDDGEEEVPMPTIDELKQYADSIYDEYKGTKLVFGKNNTVKRIMSGYQDEESALYVQDLQEFTIGNIVNGEYTPQISGVVYDDCIVIEFDLDDELIALMKYNLVR